mgnify:CR=1 FL=1
MYRWLRMASRASVGWLWFALSPMWAVAGQDQRPSSATPSLHRTAMPPKNLSAIKKEVESYKRFRALVEEVTELSLEASRLRHKRECPHRADP